MRRRTTIAQRSAGTLLAALILAPAAARAQQPVDLLPLDEEVDLALSAAPPALKDGAGVYALQKDGWVKVRESTNGFTCAVNRDHPLARKPTCWDAEGTATILPVVMRFGELLLKGVAIPEIRKEIADGFASGKYISPRRPGIAYMMSDRIRRYVAQTGKTASFPPHFMFYAPNLTNKDIGFDGDFSSGLPFIGYQGPQGYMIVVPKQSKD